MELSMKLRPLKIMSPSQGLSIRRFLNHDISFVDVIFKYELIDSVQKLHETKKP
jgi:hypothetical protein